MMQALGLIEVIGYPAAIEAADAALKASNVQLSGVSKVGSGIMTVQLFGDVGAITAAVQAGGNAAERIGKVRTTHVIPRVDESLIGKVIQSKAIKANKENSDELGLRQQEALEPEEMQQGQEVQDSADDTSIKESNILNADTELKTEQVTNEEIVSTDELSKKSNTELRDLIQALGINVPIKKLREAKKSELIKMITEARQ